MTIKKWDPFRDLLEISHDMDRNFEEGFGRFRHHDAYGSVWAPAVDMCETDKEIIVRAELPGIKNEDLVVEVDDDHLILRGVRRLDKDATDENYHRIERAHGEFFRALRLPSPIKEDEIQASYRDGVLSITLPKTEASKTRAIEIETV
jgi:HSP20 family protein